jgi:serine phosphatase RsbU (regulator of sigma subunit)
VQLSAGDRVFIYSDGIELAFSSGDKIDTTRWRDELLARRDQSTEQILRDFADHVDRAAEHSLQKKDDLTVIVLEVD